MKFVGDVEFSCNILFLPPTPTTIDLALALPTLRVVLGSRLGGRGAGDRPISNSHLINSEIQFQYKILT